MKIYFDKDKFIIEEYIRSKPYYKLLTEAQIQNKVDEFIDFMDKYITVKQIKDE